MSSPRVLFHVQHLLGIGHLVRAGRIAEAMARQGMAVTLVMGGQPIPGFAPSGVTLHQLPAMAVGGDGFAELVDGQGRPVDAAFRQRRCNELLALYRQLQPDVVMLEAFPFGRRQMRYELLPLIECIEATQPRPLLLSSIRDILQRRRKPGRDEESAALIRQHFDRVLVHGDPRLITLSESFSQAESIAELISYTGLVCGAPPETSPGRFDIVVSAGGGAVGEALISTAVQAASTLPSTLSWCVIAGPNLSAERFAALQSHCPDNLCLQRFRADFPQLLARAELSISQAGYNTAGDILQAGCRSILVPFSAGGENEQSDRAHRLQALGLATVLTEARLDAPVLALAVRQSLAADRPSRLPDAVSSSADSVLDTGGADASARLVMALIRDRNRGATP